MTTRLFSSARLAITLALLIFCAARIDAAAATDPTATDPKVLEQKSQQFVAALIDGNYDAVAPMIAAEANLSKERFIEFGAAVKEGLGKFRSLSQASTDTAGDGTTKAVYLCDFEGGQARLALTFSSDDKIQLMAFKPVQ
ncbi:MAG: DUF3887 domain-containing protein [Rhizobacter sp.]|nr:DUF3887 domain-containing protein [Chlorobiales bacterium]